MKEILLLGDLRIIDGKDKRVSAHVENPGGASAHSGEPQIILAKADTRNDGLVVGLVHEVDIEQRANQSSPYFLYLAGCVDGLK